MFTLQCINLDQWIIKPSVEISKTFFNTSIYIQTYSVPVTSQRVCSGMFLLYAPYERVCVCGRFVFSWVDLYYSGDNEVEQDSELQQWLSELNTHGFIHNSSVFVCLYLVTLIVDP